MADSALLVLVALVVVAVAIAVYLFVQARKRRIQESLRAVLARDPRWRLDTALCGRGPSQLAGRCPATPRGDRRYGLEHVITGPLDIVALGAPRTCWASCGIWWYEVEQTDTDEDGRTTRTYSRKEVPVVAVALPVALPTEVTIGSESLFGRIGLTRGGQQVESDAFNRRFRVEGADPALTVQLLDAQLQQHLLEQYAGRTLWLSGDLAVLGGKTDRSDPSLYGPIRSLPGLQADAADLLGHVPAQFWRAVGLPSPGQPASPDWPAPTGPAAGPAGPQSTPPPTPVAPPEPPAGGPPPPPLG
jgi:hypothetical protein